MKPNFWHRTDKLARDLTPFALTFVLVIINAIPYHVPGFSRIAPTLPLIGVYYWAVYRPELMPAVAVFGIGILNDFLSGLPAGVSALTFLAVHWVTLAQRRFLSRKAFVIVWFGFAVVAAGALAMQWLVMSIYVGQLIEVRALFYHFAMTAAIFPLPAWIFTRWQQTFLAVD
ncbi:MAG: rod shape-determining protein MreD [Proteobacteria bacterium]|nr:rod shape-determining protein MreD [Pseudomonadota bacterium]